jgi:hypothetical protein
MNNPAAALIVATLSVLISGCGGGGGGSSSNQPAPLDPVIYEGQALLGPVVGASVTVYPLGAYSTPVCTVITSEGNTLDTAGIIRIEDSCIDSDTLYILAISGGNDIDANDDGVIDDSPTPVMGTFHAVMSDEQIREGNWNVNAISEIAYQQVQYLLDSAADQTQVQEALSQAARQLLNDDINNDNAVNYRDLNRWSPREHMHLYRGNSELLSEVVNNIHNDIPTRTVARQILHLPEDIFLPTQPVVTDINIAQNYAYLCGRDGVEIYDANFTDQPSLQGFFEIDDADHSVYGASCAATDDGYLFYAPRDFASDAQLNIINAQSPGLLATSTIELGSGKLPLDVQVSGDYLYVRQRLLGDDMFFHGAIDIYDISNRESPEFVSSLDSTAAVFLGGHAFGDRFYTVEQIYEDDFSDFLFSRISVFDISNPRSPSKLGEREFPARIGDIIVHNGIAYVTENDYFGIPLVETRLYAFDLSLLLSGDALPEPMRLDADLGSSESLWIDDSTLFSIHYQSMSSSSLVAMDITDSLNPKLIDNKTMDRYESILIKNKRLWFDTDVGSFSIKYLRTQSDFQYRTLISTESPVYTTKLLDNKVILAHKTNVQIAEIGADNTAQILSSINLIDDYDDVRVNDIEIQGSTVLIAGLAYDWSASTGSLPRVWLYDLSDSTTPTPINHLPLETEPRAITIENQTLYIAADTGGLVIADISNVAEPAVVGQAALSGTPEFNEAAGVVVSGGFAYVRDEGIDLKIADITNSTAPEFVSFYNSPNELGGKETYPYDLAIAGDIAYVADGNFIWDYPGAIPEINGVLQSIDISNPLNPTPIVTLTTSGSSTDLSYDDGLLYIADRKGIVDFVDVSDPASPIWLYSTQVPGQLYNISHDLDSIYVSSSVGLIVLDKPEGQLLP